MKEDDIQNAGGKHGTEIGKVPEGFPLSYEAEDISLLIRALHTFHQVENRSFGSDMRVEQLAWAVSVTMLTFPEEICLLEDSSLDRLELLDRFADLRPDDLPEAHLCRAWLEPAADISDQRADFLISLGEKVFAPASLLLYRLLVRLGRRRELSRMIPITGPLTVFQADALLETGELALLTSGWIERIQPDGNGLISSELHTRWLALLQGETELATGEASDVAQAALEGLAAVGDICRPGTFAAALQRYISSRTAAALTRARIGSRLVGFDCLDSDAGRWLPLWEREYLQGLSCQVLGNNDTAYLHLKKSLADNPFQNAVRIALAGLVARECPEDALGLLAPATPSRELNVIKAALLTRCCLFDEAGKELMARRDGTLSRESVRLFWSTARKHLEQQALALETAVLEQGEDWQKAAVSWQTYGSLGLPDTLRKTRALFHAVRERASLAAHQTWRRSLLDQQITRTRHELRLAVLNRDALFFWSLANFAEDPEQALQGLKRLLRQSRWVQAQQRVGAARLVLIGDLLLKKSQTTDAYLAYSLAARAGRPDMSPRLQVAWAMIARPLDAGASMPREAGISDGFYPVLLAAMERISAGRKEDAELKLAEAEVLQAPKALCRVLRQIVSGNLLDSHVTEEDFQALSLPESIGVVVRLLAGPGSWEERMKTFVHTRGPQWPSDCPMSPVPLAATLVNVQYLEGDWGAIAETAIHLTETGNRQLQKIATLARILNALRKAVDSDLESAEDELKAL